MALRRSQNSVEFDHVIHDEVPGEDNPSEKTGTAIDRKDMLRMGKMQEFRRNFTFIPIFGFAAVLMITWEAVMASASYVIPNGGRPAIVWMFLVSVFGFGAAILSMAEMASMAPTSGGQYLGWFCVLGWQAGVAGQSFGAGSQIQGLIILNNSDYVPQPWHGTLLSIGVVFVCVIFNTFFARKLPLVEGTVLVLHICGFFAILVPLWVFADKASHSEVWLEFTNEGGWPTVGLACLVGLTSSVNALIGPDSAVHMSEEIQDASRVLPIAMTWTLISNGALGFIMAVTYAYCLGNYDDALTPQYNFAFIGSYYQAVNSRAGATVMSCIIVVLSICSAISNVATGSRQLFAFARDNGLPFAKWLSYVRPGWDIPLNSILVIFTIAVLLSLINLGSDVAFNAILSIGVVALLTSYLVSISCILYKRIRNEPLLPRRWDLGKWGMPLNIIGLCYLAIAYVFAFFPLGADPNAMNMNWASAVYGGVAIFSFVFYITYAKDRYVAPVSRLVKDL